MKLRGKSLNDGHFKHTHKAKRFYRPMLLSLSVLLCMITIHQSVYISLILRDIHVDAFVNVKVLHILYVVRLQSLLPECAILLEIKIPNCTFYC